MAKNMIIIIKVQLVGDTLKIMPLGSVIINEDMIQSISRLLIFISILLKLKISKLTSFFVPPTFSRWRGFPPKLSQSWQTHLNLSCSVIPSNPWYIPPLIRIPTPQNNHVLKMAVIYFFLFSLTTIVYKRVNTLQIYYSLPP